jgi:hypothetical protein
VRYKIQNFYRYLILFALITSIIAGNTISISSAAVNPLDDSILARRYERFLKYEKYQLYKEYKEVKKYKDYKKYADSYRLYKKHPKKYASYAKYKSYYDDYQKYKKKKKYAKYSKYAFFNKEKNKKYGTATHKTAYERQSVKAAPFEQSNPVISANYSASPKIRVGLTSFKKSSLDDKAITVKVNSASQIQEAGGAVLAKVPDNTEIRIFFDFSEKEYRVVSVNLDNKTSKAIVIIPDNQEQGVCYITNVGSYRGNIEVRYASFTKNLWVINELPIEYYVWGMGEATNSSPMEYLKALSVAYRTYGYWKVVNGTTYKKEGFHVTDTGSSQVYGGYGREDNQPNIVSAAKATSGIIVKHGDRIAITPYCSGTDGNTRDWKDVWGSDNYPWCKSVPDPLGIKSNATTLSGNHMVGMSATGAYNYAKDQGWAYDKILTYYYQGVSLAPGW